MLTNTEKSVYLWSLENLLFARNDMSFKQELQPIFTAAQKEMGALNPIKYKGTVIEHPYMAVLGASQQHIYRKPITITDPKIREMFDEYTNRKGVYDRRKALIIAFTKRMMWQCDEFGDLAYIEPKGFHDEGVFWSAKLKLEDHFPDQSFYTDPTPKHDKIKQEFYAKETEALKEIDRHILIEQLKG